MALDMEGGTKEEDMAIKEEGMAIKEEGMVAIKDSLLGTMVAILIMLAERVLGIGN